MNHPIVHPGSKSVKVESLLMRDRVPSWFTVPFPLVLSAHIPTGLASGAGSILCCWLYFMAGLVVVDGPAGKSLHDL